MTTWNWKALLCCNLFLKMGLLWDGNITVDLPELSECVTMKSWFMKLDIFQFLQNTLEVFSSQHSLTYIRHQCSNYSGFKNIPNFIQSVILEVSTCRNMYCKNVGLQCTLPKRIGLLLLARPFLKHLQQKNCLNEIIHHNCFPICFLFHLKYQHTKVKSIYLAFSFGTVFPLHCFSYNGEIKVSKLSTIISS